MPGAQRVREWVPIIALVFVSLCPYVSYAQIVSEDQVKAAYLYNFAKFVEWPAGQFMSPSAPIRLCVLGNPAIEFELDQVIKGRNIAGRPIAILAVHNGDQISGCQILFVDSSEDRQARHIIEVLRDKGVLTVGETEGFIEKGGIINFVVQDDHIQFEVNHKAANQSGLHVSSRLLSVARHVVE